MSIARIRLERAALRFLSDADVLHDDLFPSRDHVVAVGRALLPVAAAARWLADESRDDDAPDGNGDREHEQALASYCALVRHHAATLEQHLVAPGTGERVGALTALRIGVDDAETLVRSLHVTLVVMRGGDVREEMSLPELVRPASTVAVPVEPVERPIVPVRVAIASARRAIGLAVLVLPRAHRARFHEEWIALISGESRIRQVRFACSLLAGAWSVRRALLQAPADAAADVAGDPAGRRRRPFRPY